MAAEDLPSDFDIIVLGTGLTETITAAAFSRIGLKVLHLDRHDYYGGAYGNFNLEGLETWKQKNIELSAEQETISDSISDEVTKVLEDGETAVRLPNESAQAFNLKSQYYVRERTAEEQAAADAKKAKSRFNFGAMYFPCVTYETAEEEESSEATGVNKCASSDAVDSDKSQIDSCEIKTAESNEKTDAELSNQEDLVSELSRASLDNSGDKETSGGEIDTRTENTDSGIQSEKSALSSNETDEDKDKANEKPSEQTQAEVSKTQDSDQTTPKEWTVGDIKDEWRRYCFDISPRVLYCSGDVVDLLIQSDVARYCEFRTVSRVVTMLKDTLQQVPCSRADVFSSKIVSLIEKRLMMKFLQFAAEFEKSPQEYQDYIGKPFVEFLKSKKLSATVQHFVQHAIAMVTDDVLTEDALKRTKKFLHSLGRYGNTAFLFPLYGTGELPQAFSRLSAVFGGIYCLALSASHLLIDSDKKCCGIITATGQKIKCKYLVAETSYLPKSYINTISNRKTSRAIFITPSSILPSEGEELSMLNFVCQQDPAKPVTLLELPPSACVCPKEQSVVHLTRDSVSDDAEEDLKEVREKLFSSDNSDEDEKRPKILWSMYFQQEDRSRVVTTPLAPENVLVTSGGGDAQVELDFCVEEAKTIFHAVCPDEEFLPKPPDPEDIIHVDDTDSAVATGPSEFASGEDGGSGKGEENFDEQKPDAAKTNEQDTSGPSPAVLEPN